MEPDAKARRFDEDRQNQHRIAKGPSRVRGSDFDSAPHGRFTANDVFRNSLEISGGGFRRDAGGHGRDAHAPGRFGRTSSLSQ